VSPSSSATDLRERLVDLAGTPDDSPAVRTGLAVIAQLTADWISAVSYASVTTLGPGGYATVAATSELALAVDEAQYAERSGPCLEALTDARVTEVPDISATMAWPGFRETALELGLKASLSIPLFAGRGTPVAALNLYSRQPSAMRSLTVAVESVFFLEEREQPVAGQPLDDGAKNLVAGLTGAFAVRALVQQAIGVIMALTAYGPDQAYGTLCVQAVETDVALPQAAARVVSGQRW
jgi:hypothetical protein